MNFSKTTLQILERFRKACAAGDPDADHKLAESIDAAIAGRPLPSGAESSVPVTSVHRLTPDERKARAYRKVIDGIPLDPDDENAIIFGM